MPISYKIRLANPEDVIFLSEIERKASSLFEGTKQYSAVGDDVTTFADFKKAQEANHLFVAVNENNTPVGFAFMEIMDYGVHLDELDVLPEYAGQGIGAALVKKVCAWAKENSYRVVTLTTYKDIPWNEPFYKKLGFRGVSVENMSKQLYQLFLDEHKYGLLMEDRVVMEFKIK